MKIGTDKEILKAAQECSDEYQREAHAEGMETTASWKEVAFFIKGAEWMREHQRRIDIDKACRWLRKNMQLRGTAFALTDPPQPGKFINAEDAFIRAMKEDDACQQEGEG